MAAALFELATATLVPAQAATGDGGGLVVASAGLLESGRPVSPEVVTALTPYGIDLSGHRSTQLATAALESADLVLGMERRHGREAILLVPSAWARTFTLKDLVRRGEKVGARPPGEPLSRWLDEVADGRERTSLIGRSPEDEVADPLGGPPAAYRATAAELADLVGRLALLLWPGSSDLSPSGPSPSGPSLSGPEPGVPIAE